MVDMLPSFNYQVFLNKKVKINVVFAYSIQPGHMTSQSATRIEERASGFDGTSQRLDGQSRRHTRGRGSPGLAQAAVCGAGAHAPCVPQQDELLTQHQRPGKRDVRGVRRLHTYTPAASRLPTRPAKNVS